MANRTGNETPLKFEYANHKGERKIRTVLPSRILYGLDPDTDSQEWLLEGFDLDENTNSLFVMKNIQRIIDKEPQRFLCVTVYVTNPDNKLLMILNRKLNKWVPPGGKVDNHETPDEAAIRECFEETGVKIKLCGQTPEIEEALITPLGSQCNIIKNGIRDHIDLIYQAEPIDKNEKLNISDREASDIGWFTLDEVQNLDTFESVKYWFKKILQQK